MKPAPDPITLARAVELTVALSRLSAKWPDHSRGDGIAGLALAITTAAPGLASADLLTLGKLGLWICAFNDYVDDEATGAEDVEQRIAQYEALVCRGEREDLAGDAVAQLLIDVLAALRAAPLGRALWPLLATQLATSLEAMRWELGARDLETYLARATDSSFVAVTATAAAMLIGEQLVSAHIPALLTAQRHAAMVVRIANDLAKPRANDRRLVQRMTAERLCVATSLTKLAAAPTTAAFLLQLTDFFVELYADIRDSEAVTARCAHRG